MKEPKKQKLISLYESPNNQNGLLGIVNKSNFFLEVLRIFYLLDFIIFFIYKI